MLIRIKWYLKNRYIIYPCMSTYLDVMKWNCLAIKDIYLLLLGTLIQLTIKRFFWIHHGLIWQNHMAMFLLKSVSLKCLFDLNFHPCSPSSAHRQLQLWCYCTCGRQVLSLLLLHLVFVFLISGQKNKHLPSILDLLFKIVWIWNYFCKLRGLARPQDDRVHFLSLHWLL